MKFSLSLAAPKHLTSLALLTVAMVAGPALAAADSLSPLRAQDERLLRIAEPLLTRNASLCERTMPALGVALQSIDQYPATAQPPFAAPVAFAAVLPGSAAAQAGIARDDGLVSIGGRPVARNPALAAAPLRDSAFAALADHPPGTPLELGIIHAGQQREVVLQPARECRALVEVLADNGNDAHSDGNVIQIDFGLATRADDGQLAAILAHELAHAVLRHRDRLSAADVKKGLLGEFGRNARLSRQAEEEADRLSVYLLANAGLDPQVAPKFWRSKLGKKLSGGIFHDAAHASAKDRARLLDGEIAQRAAAGSPPYPADLLARRTQPMD